MKILSLNISLPKMVSYHGKQIQTGIFKKPTNRKLKVYPLHIEGDGVADSEVHGGTDKAVYGYGAQYYPLWREELQREIPYGMFGENLTIDHLDESQIHLGDQFRVGSSLLEAVQPRFPCFKQALVFDDSSIVKKFLQSFRHGIYFRVLEPGEVQVGDPIVLEKQPDDSIPVRLLSEAYVNPKDRNLVKRVLDCPFVLKSWQEYFEKKLS